MCRGAESFTEGLWDDVLVQLVVEHREAPVGVVVLYGPSFPNSFVHMGAIIHPEAALGVGAEAGFRFLLFGFRTWAFRKIYLELPEFNLPQFKSIVGRYFVEEGRLKAHQWYGDRYWDKVILAAHRDEAVPRLERFVARLDSRAECWADPRRLIVGYRPLVPIAET